METKTSIKIFLIPAIFFAALFVFGNEARAAEYYYVATNGSDSNAGTSAAPWATFAKAMTVLQPGDTLYIKDGTYTETLKITISGTSGNPVTIKAENDGQVIIDGQNVRKCIYVYNRSYIDIEGIYVKNAGPSTSGNDYPIEINSSSYANLKRVTASGSVTSGETAILVYSSNHVLIEDCASYGYGRNVIEATHSDYITVRRCYVRYYKSPATASGVGDGIIFYPASNCIAENNIVVMPASVYDEDGHLLSIGGVTVWRAEWDSSHDANNNKIYGNIVIGVNKWAYYNASRTYRIQGNEFKNNVSINSSNGMMVDGDADSTNDRNTIVGSASAIGFNASTFSSTKAVDFEQNTVLKNNSFISMTYGISYTPSSYIKSFVNKYNNRYSINTPYCGSVTQGTGEITVNPAYNTANYGNGAYLMIPTALAGQGEAGVDIGAKVLYRYVDGVLGSTPLWPWPMEDRIKAETGYSVTWEANGGLWKTLNGVYGSDTTPPAAPSGLAVQ